MRSQQQSVFLRLFFALLVLASYTASAWGSVSLLMEEPFGTFGAFNPTGHAAVYLSGVCAERPTLLRLCRSGEQGVVISRYHHVKGYDWIAIPLVPYLYSVEKLSDKPESITPALEAELRDNYRREHFVELAPSRADGSAPSGEWIQLVGASYDRRIYAFQVATSMEQDLALIAKLNDRKNESHFNLFYRNCADFARSVLRTLYPEAIPRNTLADFGLTTPKHLARSLMKAGQKYPEMRYHTFQIPQVPGTTRRSHHVDGIAESLVRSKKYIVPLALVSPTTAATLLVAYVGAGRFSVPKGVPLLPELTPVPRPLLLDSNSIVIDTSSDETSASTLACSIERLQNSEENVSGAN